MKQLLMNRLTVALLVVLAMGLGAVSANAGSALQFNGVDAYVEVADSESMYEDWDQITISAWFRMDGLADGIQIIGKGDRAFSLRRDASVSPPRLAFMLRTETGDILPPAGYWGTPSDNVFLGQWYHVASTWDGITARIYIDGELHNEEATDPTAGALGIGGPSGSADPVHIGCNWNRTVLRRFWNGIIDEVSLWRRGLTQEEIQALMGGELSGSEDGLVGYWKFNEGSGTTAFDSSPNGNHGTIYNATWTTDAAPDITLVITQEPTPVSAPAGTVTNLAVTVTGMNPRYQWYKDTVAIPDATNSVLVFDPLQPSDAGSYYVVVTNSNNAVTSATVAVTVTGTDTTPPTVDLVVAGGSVRSVTVVFSERVSDATATDARNYQITDALGGTVEVTEASLAADGRTVTLTTAESMQDAEYTLVITGVQDLATPPNTIAEGTSQTFVLATILGDWQFSEASSATGTTADSSGNGYDGTLVDFDAGTGLTGDGQVLFADNNANRVTTELPLSLLSTNFMVDITFTYTGEGDRMWTPLLGSSQAPYSPAQIFYIGKNNLNTQLYLGLGGIYLGAVTPPVNLFDGAQHRLVVTFSRADRELKLYADGSDTPFFTLAPTPVAAGYFTGTSSLWIGAVGHAYAGGETWVGSLDRVIVRNAISIFEPPILPLAFLSPVLVDGKIILNWTGTGRLESAPSVLGPWEEVTPQPTTPPYPEDLVPGGNRYFRLNATPAPENTLGLVDASGTRQQGTSLDAIRFVAESSFSADTMHARFTDTSAPGVMRMAIYADDGSDAPGTVLGDTFQFDIGGGGLRSAALNTPVEITEGNVYWIATWVQTVSANVTFVATDGVGTRYRATPTYSATDPFPDGSTLSFSAETTYAVFASGM